MFFRISRAVILPALIVSTSTCSSTDPPEFACEELEQRYLEALKQVRGCSPQVAAVQCSERVDNKLACPCPLMVNPSNGDALTTLKDSKQRWQQQGCAPKECPAIGCFEPKRGLCRVLPDDPNSGGRCENDTQ